MSFIEFSRTKDDAALAVGLVNTWDTFAREPEHLPDLGALREFLHFYGQEGLARRVSRDDLAGARKLRARLRSAFDAKRDREAVETLNDILAGSGSPPQLERAGMRWVYRHHDPDARAINVLAAKTAFALLDVIRAGGAARLGHCAARPCRCVFVDRSRNRSRRYCCQLCADRATQAAFRRRQKRTGDRGART